MRVTSVLALVAILALTLAGCSSSTLSAAPKIVVTSPRTPLPASPSVGAAYLTIKNDSSEPDVLLSATSDVAGQTMLHFDVTNGSTESMVPAGPVTIASGKTLVLQPGGYHLMLMNLKRTLAVGQTIQVQLVFKRAGTITVNVPVVPLLSASATDNTMPPGMHMSS